MEMQLPGIGDFTVRTETQAGLGDLEDPLTGDPLRALHITGERSIDPGGLRLVNDLSYQLDEDGRRFPDPGLTAPEANLLAEGATAIRGAISFATGVMLPLSVTLGDVYRNEVIAETAEDASRLDAMGTRRATWPADPFLGIEVFGEAEIDSSFIAELARRGIAGVYADALGSMSESTRYLALWRTLEFSFQAEKKELTDLILAFPRVTEMEFDRVELVKLASIRGRLSHARTRAGLAELHRADTLAHSYLGRLWSLVDWVVLSKRSADQSGDSDELAALEAFIDRNGNVRLVDGTADPFDWFRRWSEWSPRFHGPPG
jgi:hypothetical protein